MKAVSLEARAWQRLATQTTHTLPEEIVAAVDKLTEIEAALAELGPPPKVPEVHAVQQEGFEPEDARAEQRRRQADAAEHATRWDDLQYAKSAAAHQVNSATAKARHELVLGLRPFFDKLIEKARPIVAAGHHDEVAVLRDGDAKALKAHQKITEMESQFGRAMAAWRSAYKAEVIVPGSFDVREVNEGFVYWERPDLVRDDSLAGRALTRMGRPRAVQPTLAGVAAEAPECGFRPALLPELKAVHDRLLPEAMEAQVPVSRVGVGVIA